MKFDKLFLKWEDAFKYKNTDKALILEFIRWSIHYKQSNYNENIKRHYYFDNHWWMQDSMSAWVYRMPWLSERTLRRYINDLVNCGALVKKASKETHGGSNPNFYRIPECEKGIVNLDPPTLSQNASTLLSQNASTPSRKMASSSISNNQSNNLSNNHSVTSNEVTRAIKYNTLDFELANEWLEHAKLHSKTKPYKSWTQENFAIAIAKAKRSSGLSHTQIVYVLEFLKNDEFWRPNCLTPTALLKKSKTNDLRKVENIISAIKEKKNNSGNKYNVQKPKLVITNIASAGGDQNVHDEEW